MKNKNRTSLCSCQWKKNSCEVWQAEDKDFKTPDEASGLSGKHRLISHVTDKEGAVIGPGTGK